MGEMYKEYQDMLDSGQYDNEEDLCNSEGINYDELYKDDDDDDE